MSRSTVFNFVSLGLLGFCLGAQATVSYAQDSATKPERIEVTGSRIKRVDSEGVTPVSKVDAAAIDRSGSADIADVLGKTSAAPTGNFAGGGLSVRSGAGTVDLLGLGSDRSLVLMDGRRLPVEASLGAANVANIPLSIIERIDVLRGGASAIYGADAVGGVVNIITKKDFDGVEGTFKISVPQHGGGEVLEAGALGGGNIGESTRGLAFFGYRKTNEVLRNNRKVKASTDDRAYTASNPPPGQFSYRTVNDLNGTPVNGSWTPSPNCPTENRVATVPSNPNDVYCAGLRKDLPNWTFPSSQEMFLVGRVEHEVSDKTTVSALGLYDIKSSHLAMGNYLSTVDDPIPGGRGILVSPARAAELGIPNVQANQNVEIFANARDMEDREGDNEDSVLGATVALDSEWNDFDVRSAFSYFASQNKRSFNNVLNKEEQIKLFHNRTNPIDPAYIPFDPNRNNALLGGIYDDLKSKEKTTSADFDVSIGKSLFDLPAGKVQGLLGFNASTLAYKQTPDARDQLFYTDPNGAIEPLYEGTAAVSGKGDRTVTSLYSELVLPLAKGAEIDAAIRFDNYSDFGSTTNYSLGGKFKVAEPLLLRGNYTTSFKAPLLSYIHSEGGGGYVEVVDETWCARERARGNVCEEGTGRQIYRDRPGNPDIKEEEGKSFSLGFVIDPLPDLSISSDYHAVTITGTHNTDDTQDVVDRFYSGASVGGNEVISDAEGIVSSLRQPVQNLGKLQLNALETRLIYNYKLSDVSLGYEGNYFRYLSYKVKDFKDAPLRQIKGYKGLPIWNLSNSFSFGFAGDQSATLSSRTVAKQQHDPNDIRPGQKYVDVEEYTEYDATYSVNLPWNGTLLVGINNLLDTQGGKDPSGNPIGAEDVNLSLYSFTGRTYFAKVTQRF